MLAPVLRPEFPLFVAPPEDAGLVAPAAEDVVEAPGVAEAANEDRLPVVVRLADDDCPVVAPLTALLIMSDESSEAEEARPEPRV